MRNIIKRVLRESTLRTFMKDWDDNILHMPTKIKMDRKVNGSWSPIEVSTRDFAELRHDPDYRPRNNSSTEAFSDFVDSEPFIRDVKTALRKKAYAPSFQDFKKTLIYADPFAINTARGHKPKILKQGVKILIDTFTQDEKNKMVKNIIDKFIKERRFPKSMEDRLGSMPVNQIIDLYLDEKGDYYSVSSKEFGKRMGVDVSGSAANPEHSKKLAIADFVRGIWRQLSYWVNSGYKTISFGFSDDDKKNVKAAVDFIENELSKEFPEIHFVVYDTSDGIKNKIVITKKRSEDEVLDKPIRKKNKSK